MEEYLIKGFGDTIGKQLYIKADIRLIKLLENVKGKLEIYER